VWRGRKPRGKCLGSFWIGDAENLLQTFWVLVNPLPEVFSRKPGERLRVKAIEIETMHLATGFLPNTADNAGLGNLEKDERNGFH
jgi:hypothetical protein